jgi:hypothetical protein
LAREAANDEIHNSTPRSAIEGGNIRKNRSVIKRAIGHARAQDLAGRKLPLHETNRASIGNSQLDSEIEASDSREEGQHVDGKCIHINSPFSPAPPASLHVLGPQRKQRLGYPVPFFAVPGIGVSGLFHPNTGDFLL